MNVEIPLIGRENFSNCDAVSIFYKRTKKGNGTRSSITPTLHCWSASKFRFRSLYNYPFMSPVAAIMFYYSSGEPYKIDNETTTIFQCRYLSEKQINSDHIIVRVYKMQSAHLIASNQNYNKLWLCVSQSHTLLAEIQNGLLPKVRKTYKSDFNEKYHKFPVQVIQGRQIVYKFN